MKTFKTVFLTFSMILFSFTFLNAADFDCGCSTNTPAGYLTTSYFANNDTCCEQSGFALVQVFDDEGTELDAYWTTQDVTYHCAGC